MVTVCLTALSVSRYREGMGEEMARTMGRIESDGAGKEKVMILSTLYFQILFR